MLHTVRFPPSTLLSSHRGHAIVVFFCLLLIMAGNNTTKSGDTTNTAPNDEECVSRLELRDMMRAMTEAFSKYQDASALSFERLDRRDSGLVDHGHDGDSSTTGYSYRRPSFH